MDNIRVPLLVVISAIGAFFYPVIDFVIAILILLVINFFSGWIEDEIHGEGWKWSKAFKTFSECAVMSGIGFFVFAIGHYMHRDEAAETLVCVVYMAGIWFYAVNILNNWKKILPEGSTLYLYISFLHFTVSLKFVNKIPFLKEFLNTNPTSKEFTDAIKKELKKEEDDTRMEN